MRCGAARVRALALGERLAHGRPAMDVPANAIGVRRCNAKRAFGPAFHIVPAAAGKLLSDEIEREVTWRNNVDNF